MTVRARVQAIFADVFDDPAFDLRDDLRAQDVPGWDSLNHINLIVGIETEFNVQFESDEIAELACVGDLFQLLARYGIADQAA